MALLDPNIQDEIYKLQNLAFEKHAENKLEEMTRFFEQAWDLCPGPKGNWNEATNSAKYAFRCYMKEKDYDQARLWVNRMTDANNIQEQDDYDVLLYRGIYLFETRKYKDAYEHFKELVKLCGYRAFEGEDPTYERFAKDPSDFLHAQEAGSSGEEDSSPEELPDDLYEEIEGLLEKGDEAAEEEDYPKAIEWYTTALTQLPSHPSDWEISLHIYTALGDACYNMEDLDKAHESYSQALKCPGGVETGYVWFGLGQIYYEQEEIKKAEDAFMRAYMLEGEEIFEDIEPSYLEVIEAYIRK
ncbi:MAG: tetratricopeptide repeat protein [Bacteroides sp.]|nr:tetratricopeptide repeat protein [Bacteroides sp.]